MLSFDEVLNNYQAKSLATRPPSTLDEIALLTTIPAELKAALVSSGRNPAQYSIRASNGAGIKSFCPWVALFKNSISTSAQHGYYIVLLFSEDLKSCVLSLNQGYTEFETKYSPIKNAKKMIRATADEVSKHVAAPQGASVGKINLSATHSLGQGYEIGAIFSYVYSSAPVAAPAPKITAVTSAQFEIDVIRLLDAFDQLEKVAGTALTRFIPSFDEELKNEIESEVVAESGNSIPPEAAGAEPPSPPLLAAVGAKYARNSKKAAFALIDANFKCEFDPSHISFISKKTGRNYVEAHHLIPMSQQQNPAYAKVNLDVRANIVSLCPNCHRLLHHAAKGSWAPILNVLLNARASKLKSKGIGVTKAFLESHYSGGVKETD